MAKKVIFILIILFIVFVGWKFMSSRSQTSTVENANTINTLGTSEEVNTNSGMANTSVTILPATEASNATE